MAWTETDNKLHATFSFKSFVEALSFVNMVATIAEQHQHHPDITIHYNRVLLSVNTHDAGNVVTSKDWALAAAIDELQ